MEYAQEEFGRCMDMILEGGRHFPQREQNFIKAWTVKLIELRDAQDVDIRNEYSRSLAALINVEKKLAPPFNALPPEGPLPPLPEIPDSELAVAAAEEGFEGTGQSQSGTRPAQSSTRQGQASPRQGQASPRGAQSTTRKGQASPRKTQAAQSAQSAHSAQDSEAEPGTDTGPDTGPDTGADTTGGEDGAGGVSAGSDTGGEAEGGAGSDAGGEAEGGAEGQQPKYVYKKMPCARKATGAIPKTRRLPRSTPTYDPFQYFNEYEDNEEIIKALARSKGQSFPEFIAAVSRHTRDFGQGLRAAMKAETSSFRDYVDNVLSQRIKDLTEVLDEEQNRVLQGVKRDIEKWQIELCNVKKRIKEVVPTFDIDLYRKDKNYIRKLFAINVAGVMPEEDSFTRFSEESADRLKWIQEMINNITSSNEQTMKDLTDFRCKAMEFKAREGNKQQQLKASLNCELQNYRHLKQERDKLFRENNELLSQLEEFNG